MLKNIEFEKIILILALILLAIGVTTGTSKIIAPLANILLFTMILIKNLRNESDQSVNYDEFESKLLNNEFKLDGKVYFLDNKAWYYTYGPFGIGRGHSPKKWQTIIQNPADFIEFLKNHNLRLIENPSFFARNKTAIYSWIFVVGSIFFLINSLYLVLLYLKII